MTKKHGGETPPWWIGEYAAKQYHAVILSEQGKPKDDNNMLVSAFAHLFNL